MNRPWMPMYWADYLADTGHLSTIQHGAYLLLIAHYWRHTCLPNDEQMLARVTRMSPEEWSENREVLASLFGDGWKHDRIDAELAKSAEISSKRRDAALHKQSKSTANVVQLHTQSQSQSQSHKKDKEGNSRRKKPETPLPDGWMPTVESVQRAQKLGFDPREVAREADKFRFYAREKDRRAVRWDAAFDKWIVNAADYQNKVPPQEAFTTFKADPGSPEFEAWRTFYRDQNKTAMLRILDQRLLEGRAFNFDTRWPPGHKVMA